MKTVIKILFSLIVLLVIFTSSCKKQAKCGCDGDIINEALGFPVYVYFDTTSNSARLRPVSNSLSTYYLCNPSDYMDFLKKFDNGAYLLVDGHIYWECNYLMRASNNPYYQTYRTYMIYVTDMYEDLYGK